MATATFTKMNQDGTHQYGLVVRLPSGRDKLVKEGDCPSFEEAHKRSIALSANA